MNLIAKRINLIGIVLLLGFTAHAAGIYFEAPARLQKPKPAATGTENYICPMHPEVTSSKAGSCPKCGMALVAASCVAPAMDGCGAQASSGCCGIPAADELMLPPGHPPVAGFKTHSGCDHEAGASTNLSK